MRSKGVIKEPGWSRIKVKDQVSAFVSSDRRHSQGEDIYRMLDLLASRESDIDDLDSLVHDAED